ncbi:MAG: DegV family protein [Nocardioidaceae bacterium]|nr:DegV family protein [Nocardioidaceae bacterium]
MSRRVALVTDSTSSLPGDVLRERGIVVVPLQVVIGAKSYDEGTQATPQTVATALREFAPVSTSRPSPEAFLRVYLDAAESGCTAVVSVHLSGEVSGTYESAELAAGKAPLPVETVDSRHVGMGTGFAVLAAADALDAGATAVQAARAAAARAAVTRAYFYVDTLEYLRRGGRIGAAAALLGSALAVKPLLVVTEGRIGPLEKVRTTGRALNRIEELAAEAAAASSTPVEVAVQHLASAERADAVAGRLKERLGLQQVYVSEVGAVIGAHVGPGMLAVVVAPRSA